MCAGIPCFYNHLGLNSLYTVAAASAMSKCFTVQSVYICNLIRYFIVTESDEQTIHGHII